MFVYFLVHSCLFFLSFQNKKVWDLKSGGNCTATVDGKKQT